MNRLKKLRDRKAAIVKRMNVILDNAGDDELSDELTAEYSQHETELNSLQPQIEREERLQEMQRSMSPVTDDNVAAAQAADARITVRDNPNGNYGSPRAFFNDVATAAATNRIPENLRRYATAGSDEHSGQDDAYGGFLVPEVMSPDLRTTGSDADPMGSRVTDIPMQAPSVSFLARVDKNHNTSVSGGLTVSRREETGTISSSRMSTEKITLQANSLFGLAYATEELLTDSPRSIAALLEAGFRDEFSTQIIRERISGTGAGEYMGILNSPCTISVAKQGGQSADTIVALNVIKMRARCWRYENAIWLANHDCLEQLIQLHIESANNAGLTKLYQQSMTEDRPDMLLGRPIYYTEWAKTLGDNGDLICGNWSQYLEGTYQPLQRAESIHVRFLNHERAFKFWVRNAGAPWWRSALTPANSSQTLSPFVTLAERA